MLKLEISYTHLQNIFNTRELLNTFRGHTWNSITVDFSPDGDVLTYSSGDAIYLWDLSTGEHINTFTGHTAMINSVVYSPDGKTVASGSLDGSILLWDLTKSVSDR